MVFLPFKEMPRAEGRVQLGNESQSTSVPSIFLRPKRLPGDFPPRFLELPPVFLDAYLTARAAA